MKLFITRHGESEENSKQIIQGTLPGKLNDTGQEQAKKLGRRLSIEKIDVIFCSPLNRCQQTLNFIKPYLNQDILVIIPEIISERDFGLLNGKKQEDVDFRKLDIDSPENQALGVESLDHLQTRIRQFLTELNQRYLNKNILIITSSNPIRMMLAEFLGKTYFEVLEQIKVTNASLSIFEIAGKKVTPVIINEIDYLVSK